VEPHGPVPRDVVGTGPRQLGAGEPAGAGVQAAARALILRERADRGADEDAQRDDDDEQAPPRPCQTGPHASNVERSPTRVKRALALPDALGTAAAAETTAPDTRA
jgi:hypothetical protein